MAKKTKKFREVAKITVKGLGSMTEAQREEVCRWLDEQKSLVMIKKDPMMGYAKSFTMTLNWGS